MPIILIWDILAIPHVPFFQRMLNDIFHVSRHLEEGLRRRFADAERAMDLTQAYPVFRFTNGAVSAYVTRAQAGLALSGPPKGLGESLAALLPHWNFPMQWANKITEARLIPRVFALLRQVAGAVAVSVKRFQKPDAAMFGEGGVSAVDLTGMAALAFRTFGAGRAGIYERMRRVTVALDDDPGLAAEQGQTKGQTAASLPFWMQVEAWSREVVAALVLLPALAGVAAALGRDLLARLRNLVATEFAEIESTLYDKRTAFVTGLSRTMTAFATATIGYALAARDFALAHLSYWGQFASDYMFGLATGLGGLATDFGTFWGGVMSLIQTLVDIGAQLMSIDLTEVIHNALVSLQYLTDFLIHVAYDVDEDPVRYEAPGSFHVSAGDLALGTGGGGEAKQQLALGVRRLRLVLAGAPRLKGMLGDLSGHWGVNLEGVLSGTELLTQRIGHAALPPGDSPKLRYSAENEPDLVKLILDPAQKGLTDIVTDLGNKANSGLQSAATSLTTMLTDAATAFDKAGAQTAWSNPARRLAEIAAGADAATTQVFPAEAAGEPPVVAPLAQAFAQGIAGGFRTMEAALGGFLGFFISEMLAHRTAGTDGLTEVTATSPRILLQHAQLARVHIPKLVLRLRPEQLDAATARRIAQGFAGAVRDAYAQGQDRISRWTLEATAREAPPAGAGGGAR